MERRDCVILHTIFRRDFGIGGAARQNSVAIDGRCQFPELRSYT
jgi:hypothetical protein